MTKKLLSLTLISLISIFLFSYTPKKDNYNNSLTNSIEADTNKVTGKILQTIPTNENITIVINKGSKNNIQVGCEGVVKELNKKFKIKAVYSYRCSAVIEKCEVAPEMEVVVDLILPTTESGKKNQK